MGKIWLIVGILILGLGGCVANAEADAPELLVPVSVQNDIFVADRGQVARFEQYRGSVRVESVGLFFREPTLPFGSFEVLVGQEVRQGDVVARLDTRRIEEQIAVRQERINDLIADHNFQNQQMERAISIAQLEHLSLTQQMMESELPTSYLLMEADLKLLEIQRRQMDLQQARDWQDFELSYYQSALSEMLSQLSDAELRAAFDGVVTYRASITQGSWLESFRSIIYISDGYSLFVEYTGPTHPPIFRNSIIRAVIGDDVYDMERLLLSPSEMLFFTRAGAQAPIRFNFIDGPCENVRLGQFVTLMVYSEIAEDVIRIPPNALFSDAELGSYVHLIENGQRSLQPVETGVRGRAWIEIRSGLLEGDEVVVQQ